MSKRFVKAVCPSVFFGSAIRLTPFACCRKIAVTFIDLPSPFSRSVMALWLLKN